MCWWDSLCMRSRSAWPVSATSGERSRNASATPVSRFVAPGPSVPRQTPARRVRRPYMSAMYAPPCSWRTGTNVIDESLERLVEVQRLLARDAEYVLDALGLQALDEQVRRLALRHILPFSTATSGRSAVSGNLRDVSRRTMTRNLSIFLCALAVAACAAAPADAAKRFTIRGAGFGHGVGMSQYGAMGYASHGWDYKRILGHYYTDTVDRRAERAAHGARAAAVGERLGGVHRRHARRRPQAVARPPPTWCAGAPAARCSCSRAAAARSRPCPRRCARPGRVRSR